MDMRVAVNAEACAKRIDWLRKYDRELLPAVADKLREQAHRPGLSDNVRWMLNWTADQAVALHAGKLEA